MMEKTYVHRIGRTARAASKGTAYTFVTGKEQLKFHRIEKLLGRPVEPSRYLHNLGLLPNPARQPTNRIKKNIKNGIAINSLFLRVYFAALQLVWMPNQKFMLVNF